MAVKVGINGFGGSAANFFRAAYKDPSIQIVASRHHRREDPRAPPEVRLRARRFESSSR